MKLKLSAILIASLLMLNSCIVLKPVENDGSTDSAKNEQGSDSTQTNQDPETDYMEYYRSTIDSLFNVASGNYDENNIPLGATALYEGNLYGETNIMLQKAGFTLSDINGDNIPELLVGSIVPEDAANTGTTVYALYTVSEEKVKLVFESASKNSYSVLDDGTIFYQGSGGAIYSIFGLYDLSSNAETISCRDYWFTYEKDGNFDDIRCWHNTAGEMDPSISEELTISHDEFWQMQRDFAGQAKIFDLTTFSEYGDM